MIRKYKEVRESDYKIRKYLNIGNEDKFFVKNSQQTEHEMRICTVGKGQTIGINDLVAGRDYSTSLKCESGTGKLFVISKDDFVTKM